MSKLALFLPFLLPLKVWATNVPLQVDEPDYNNLETVARLKFAEGINTAFFRDYKGAEIILETRDRQTKHPAWSGTVRFKPYRSDASALSPLEAEVVVKYFTHPQYFEEDRDYGTSPSSRGDDQGGIIENDSGPLRIVHTHAVSTNRGQRNYRYKKWLQDGIFEWTLERQYTITDLQDILGSLMLQGKNRFPEYLLYGYSSDGEALNCVTFSMALLQSVNVNISVSPLIDSYIKSYLKRTVWGYTTIAAGTGVGIGATAIGAAIGAAGGPIGILVGAAAGAAVGAAGGVATNFVLNRQSNLRNAATPERFIKELYNIRDELGLSIVRTRSNTVISRPGRYKNQGVLDALNMGKGRSEPKLTDFPEGCDFADYEFDY